MKKAGQAMGAVALLLLAIGLILRLTRPEEQSSFKLPDGSTITLVGVSEGTNTLTHGSVLERLLGDHLPRQGLNLLGRKLRRPRELSPNLLPGTQAPLIAWFEFTGWSNSWQTFYTERRRWKILARSATGREFENQAGTPASMATNTILWSQPLEAFPRSEKEFQLRMQLWLEPGGQTPVVEFRIPNPAPVTPRSLRANPLPQTNQLGDVALILSRVRPESGSPSEGARLDFQLLPPAGKSQDWTLIEATIEDEEGNRRGMKANAFGDNPYADMNRSLGAGKPWKITATLARTKNFPATELATLNFGSTNLLSITNASGEKFSCRFDGQTLEVDSPSWANLTYRPVLTATATDAKGGEIQPGGPEWFWMNGHYRSMKWFVPTPAPHVQWQLAAPKVLHTEFVAMPEKK